MFEKKVNELFAKNMSSFVFRNEDDKQRVIKELSAKFDFYGNEFVHSKNGAAIPEDTFVQQLYAVSKPYLKALSSGSYVPKYADTRTATQREAHTKETLKILDELLQRMGFVFKYEHLGDSTFRNLVRAKIAGEYLFEGSDPDGKVVMRKHFQGMFSAPISPIKIIEHYAAGYLDMNATRTRQAEILQEVEARVMKQQGFTSKGEIPKGRLNDFSDSVQSELQNYRTLFDKKRLPAADESEYRQEFTRRAMFRLGLRTEEEATLQQRQILSVEASDQMEKLNSLPNIAGEVIENLKNIKLPTEPWGFSSLNESGVKLPLELL